MASSTARVWMIFLVDLMSRTQPFTSWSRNGSWKLVGMRCWPPRNSLVSLKLLWSVCLISLGPESAVTMEKEAWPGWRHVARD